MDGSYEKRYEKNNIILGNLELEFTKPNTNSWHKA